MFYYDMPSYVISFDDSADGAAGGQDGSGPAVELNDLDKEFLKRNGIDPDKVGTSPQEAVRAMQLAINKGTEAQIQRAEAEKALKAMKADGSKIKNLPATILGPDGQVDQEAFKALESAAKQAVGMQEIAGLLLSNEWITPQVHEMLMDDDPGALKRAIKYGSIKINSKSGGDDDGKDSELDKVKAILTKAGLMDDQSAGQTPPPGDTDQSPAPGTFGGLTSSGTVFDQILADKQARREGRGRN